MRRSIILLAFILVACQPAPAATPTFTPPPPQPTLIPAPSLTPAPTPTAPQTTSPYTVHIHPDGGLYVGDLVSFEVVAPLEGHPPESTLSIHINPPDGPILTSQRFAGFGIGGRSQATLQWAWDTAGLQPGPHTLAFQVLPNGPAWTQTVNLSPIADLPARYQTTQWQSASTDCCTIRYLSGTAAERDLASILADVQYQAAQVSSSLNASFNQPIEVVFIPRVLGHGGFTSQAVYISYLDRRYTGSSPSQIIHHEFTHLLDTQLGGELRPTILVEGLAVYLSKGHFKPEPLFERAAALPQIGLYTPLPSLSKDFYSHHHEASYLQAGALVEFMVKTWGWSGFSAFYRDIHYPDDLSHAAAIDNALQTHFNTTLEKLDQRFLAALQAQPIEPTHLADVQTTIAFYDAARRYQLLYDPSAHFLSAWLLPIADLLDRQITADVFRHPESPENIALETMLLSAEISLQNGDFSAASQTISAVNGVLDFTANRQPQPFTAHPLAADYFALVNTLLAAGYTPQQIDIKENTARVMAASSGPQLLEIGLSKHNGVWLLD